MHARRRCVGFADVERLVRAMWPVAKKFVLFGEGDACKATLGAYLDNYKTLLEHCDRAWEAIRDTTTSQLEEIKAAVKRANMAIAEVVSFGVTVFECIMCAKNRANAATIVAGYGLYGTGVPPATRCESCGLGF